MGKGNFPLMYLGCPISHSKKEKEDFAKLMGMIKNKLLELKGKLLSYGGKEILLKSVLYSVHIYMLLTLVPPQECFQKYPKNLYKILLV